MANKTNLSIEFPGRVLSMMACGRFLLVLVCAFMASAMDLSVGAKPNDPNSLAWPTSSEWSKKRGSFEYAVKANPDTFTWEGHKVVIYDCWKDGIYLFFKLNIDGRDNGEHRIYKNRKMNIIFEELSSNNRDSWYIAMPWRRVVKGFLGFPCLEFVHSILARDAQNMRLRVGTLHENPRSKHGSDDPDFSKVSDPVMSDTIVTFDLSGVETKRE